MQSQLEASSSLYLSLKLVALFTTASLVMVRQGTQSPKKNPAVAIYSGAICTLVVCILGLEVLMIRRFPNLLVRGLAKITTGWLVLVVCLQICILIVMNRENAKDGSSLLLQILSTPVYFVIGGGGAATVALWIAPWYGFPGSSGIVPGLPGLRDIGYLVAFIALAILVIAVVVRRLVHIAMLSKSTAGLDEEQQQPSLIVEVPSTAYYLLKEILLGIYRAVQGQKEGRKHPPSITITKKTQ